MMWAEAGKQVLLALIGISAGTAVAGGLFSFIVELGVVADFADRTHTGDRILFYESCVALGGILGNLFYLAGGWLFRTVPGAAVFLWKTAAGDVLLGAFGLLSGIFVGCWAMALAENLNVFPVFMRRIRIVRYTAAFVMSVAIGKSGGALLFFWQRW